MSTIEETLREFNTSETVTISKKATETLASEKDLYATASGLASDVFELKIQEQKLLIALQKVQKQIAEKNTQRRVCLIAAKALVDGAEVTNLYDPTTVYARTRPYIHQH